MRVKEGFRGRKGGKEGQSREWWVSEKVSKKEGKTEGEVVKRNVIEEEDFCPEQRETERGVGSYRNHSQGLRVRVR